jgi:imidazolonepropionase-like amidohydrolase
MPPVDALRAATVKPVQLLNAATLSGLVKPGYRADLVLLKANPLVDISNTRRVVGVVLGGEYRQIVAAISEAR